MNKKLYYALITIIYAVIACVLAIIIYRNGIYPSGEDVYLHLYKGNVLLANILQGNFYPALDKSWYSGVEMMSYWGPAFGYLIALCQALCMGNILQGYLLYIGILYFVTATVFFVISVKLKRPVAGAVAGAILFFMPSNLELVFMDGNLCGGLFMAFFPVLLYEIYNFIIERIYKAYRNFIIVFALLGFCHLQFLLMAALVLVLYMLILAASNKGKLSLCISGIVGMSVSLLIPGIWAFNAYKDGILSVDTTMQANRYFVDFFTTINPIGKLFSEYEVYYFGLALVLLIVFGLICAKKKTVECFVTAGIIYLFSLSFMKTIVLSISKSELAYMNRYMPFAVALIFIGFVHWESLKKKFVVIVLILVSLDSALSVKQYIYGNANNYSAEDRLIKAADEALISDAKAITKQKLTLIDEGTLGSKGAYMVSCDLDDIKGVDAVFGAGIKGASTNYNVVQLNEAVDEQAFYYLFDRCKEVCSDTVLLKMDIVDGYMITVGQIDDAAAASGYDLIENNEEYRLYHFDSPYDSWGVISDYRAIGIGTSAPAISISFPSVKETKSNNLNDYTYDELKNYDVIYLAGFSYNNRKEAEDMLLKLADNGSRIIILADGIPADEKTGVSTFLGVDTFNITFKHGYPALDTIDGEIYADLFPSGYTNWNTVYCNNLENVWGSLEDMDMKIDFYGTIHDDSIIFIGLNLTYHYGLTRDRAVGTLLSHALDVSIGELPSRRVVPIEIKDNKNGYTIVSKYNHVDTGIAYHDIFDADKKIYDDNNLTYVNKGITKISVRHRNFYYGIIMSLIGLILAFAMCMIVKKKLQSEQMEAVEANGATETIKESKKVKSGINLLAYNGADTKTAEKKESETAVEITTDDVAEIKSGINNNGNDYRDYDSIDESDYKDYDDLFDCNYKNY